VTGAVVTAKIETRTPHYQISYSINMPDAVVQGSEEITGTTLALGSWDACTSTFSYQSDDYIASFDRRTYH